MKAKFWSLIVLSFVGLMLVSGCASGILDAAEAPTATPVSETAPAVNAGPAEVVEVFYTAWLAYEGNPLVDKLYQSNPYLSDAAEQKIADIIASFERGGYDPVLCAQDWPQHFVFETPTVTDDTATTTVHGVWNAGTEYESLNDIEVTLVVIEGQWQITDITCPPPDVQAPAPRTSAMIPDIRLHFEAPATWQRLDPEWAWTPDANGEMQVGVNWVYLEPPMEMEAVLLPPSAQILAAEPMATSLGEGRSFTLETYGGAPQGDAKAPVRTAETHVLVQVERAGQRLGVDFYASAPTADQLAELDDALRSLISSAHWADEASASGWQIYQDADYGFAFQYPADWEVQEIATDGPGAPEDYPVERVVSLFPASMAEALKQSGPPNPEQSPAVAPLSVEVCVGDEAQFRRAFSEPTATFPLEVDGLTMIREESYVNDQITQLRYIYPHPTQPDVRIVFTDHLTGFVARAKDRTDVVAFLPEIIESLT
ncbi:MAG: DUF3828 domain-containing protein, partial [Chloroflexi bacterium]|nr:DUF3828 domain-containing protein [Chloroflexota bacterium]